MTNRKMARIVTVAAAAAAVALAVPSADAATATHKIVAGTTASGTTSYLGKTVGTPGIKFVDNGVTLTCASGTAAGVLKLGKVPYANIATITKTTWKTCTGAGQTFTVTQKNVWNLSTSGPTSSTGVTPGYISNVTAVVKAAALPGCSFTVTGSVPGRYTNSTHKLAVKSAGTAHRLTVTSGGCLSLVNKGDHPTFSAVYAISTPKGAVKITNK